MHTSRWIILLPLLASSCAGGSWRNVEADAFLLASMHVENKAHEHAMVSRRVVSKTETAIEGDARDYALSYLRKEGYREGVVEQNRLWSYVYAFDNVEGEWTLEQGTLPEGIDYAELLLQHNDGGILDLLSSAERNAKRSYSLGVGFKMEFSSNTLYPADSYFHEASYTLDSSCYLIHSEERRVMHMEIDHLDSSLPYSITIDLEEFVTLDIAYYFAPAIEENSSTAEEEIPSSVLDVSVF